MQELNLTVEDPTNMNIARQHDQLKDGYSAPIRTVLNRIQCFAESSKALDTKSLRVDVGVVTFAGYTPLLHMEKNPE